MKTLGRFVVGVSIFALGLLIGWQWQKQIAERDLVSVIFVQEIANAVSSTQCLKVLGDNDTALTKRILEMQLVDSLNQAAYCESRGAVTDRVFPNIREGLREAAEYLKKSNSTESAALIAQRLLSHMEQGNE